jgi:hypothetical protein
MRQPVDNLGFEAGTFLYGTHRFDEVCILATDRAAEQSLALA